MDQFYARSLDGSPLLATSLNRGAVKFEIGQESAYLIAEDVVGLVRFLIAAYGFGPGQPRLVKADTNEAR